MSNFKKQFISFFLCFTFLLPSISLAINLNLDYPAFGGFDPNNEEQQDINQVIAWFYYFVVGISGFFAFFGLVMGGFTWLTSAGNPSKIADAKDQILAAILGLVLILATWVILQIINPELTTLRLPILSDI